jgi:hypothetical protein
VISVSIYGKGLSTCIFVPWKYIVVLCFASGFMRKCRSNSNLYYRHLSNTDTSSINAPLYYRHFSKNIVLFAVGGVLAACQLRDDLLIAGYANGKTCLWNIESNWQHSLQASAEVHQDPSKASVECVAVLDNVCATAFSCGGLFFCTNGNGTLY